LSCAFLLPTRSSLCSNGLPVSRCVSEPASGNLFSEEQEVCLGDAIADLVENKYAVVKDGAQNGYLEKIGARLLAVLPPTQVFAS
jgi:predicted Zn-dependent protease